MMALTTAAMAMNATLHGSDAQFLAVCSDTRKLRQGDLFIALVGENYDGHDFVSQAQQAGAVAALVSRAQDQGLPYLLVHDTRLGLGQLAGYWRQQFRIPVIAITGSNGKTTVKEMLAAILCQSARGIATQGNLNNDIGVPLTLLRLRQGDSYAVIEMGMNHRGEIDYLSRMTRPTVALVNNAAEAHLAGLGSVAEIAQAKGEIFSGLAKDGVAIINADDAYADLWRRLAADRECLSFGMQQAADVRAEYRPTETGSLLQMTTPQGEIEMRIPLPGRHNAMNALAASAASLAAGARLVDIKKGLEKLRAVSGRLELKQGINGARVLDDTYNANPDSLAAGLEVLKQAFGERILVLGDMAELGDAASTIHRRVGELARRVGVTRLFALGEMSRLAVEGFGKGGRHFDSHQALIEELLDCMHTDVTVLIKGSRIMHMERIVQGIIPQVTSEGGK